MPDVEITSAVANWGPRFTAQGVDPGDFARVTGPLERWADWLDAWCANGDLHAELARHAEDAGRFRTAGEAWVRASLSYHFAKFVWMLDQAKHRTAADQGVAAMAHAHRLLDPTAERVELDFDGATMVGNLRRPAGADRQSGGHHGMGPLGPVGPGRTDRPAHPALCGLGPGPGQRGLRHVHLPSLDAALR